MFPLLGPHCWDAAVNAKQEAIKIEKRMVMVTVTINATIERERDKQLKFIANWIADRLQKLFGEQYV